MNPAENLGRHSLPPLSRISSRDSTTRLEQPNQQHKGYKGGRTYHHTLLDIENSNRAKDTWCSPHCLNVVHGEAGDECVPEKLKKGKFCQRCRDTSLRASSGGTRTSPRTEPWSAMQAGVLLSVFFRASSRGCRRRRRNCLLGEQRSNDRGGLVTGWPKTSRRGKQERRHCRAQKQARLGSGNTAGGLPFYTSMETQRSSQPMEVGTRGVIQRWQHEAR
jgi:hypothetical protein